MSKSDLDRSRLLAIGEALLAAAIWSSSFVGVKIMLSYTGPFTAGGVRFFIAFLLLAPFLLMRRRRRPSLTRREWFHLSTMGICQYTIGNAAMFSALKTISATSGSLALSFVPIPILVLSAILLGERPRVVQFVGIAAAIGGSVLFFSPSVDAQSPRAFVELAITVLSFTVFPVFGRRFARSRSLDNVTLTAVPLGIGGGALLASAMLIEGPPHMPVGVWGIMMGMAIVNTVIAYLLYNHALQHLTAVQVNVLINLSPLGTALIAWGTLGERLMSLQMVAMFMIIAGATLAQWRSPFLNPQQR